LLRNKLLVGAFLLIWQLSAADLAQASAQASKNENAKIEQKDKQISKATSVKITDVTNLRSGAGLEYKIIGKAKKGESYPVIGSEGEWYKISLPAGGKAYVASWVVSTDVKSTATKSTDTKNTDTKNTDTKNTDTKSNSICYSDGKSAAKEVQSSAAGSGQKNEKVTSVHITDNTNRRKGPGTDYDIIGKAKPGDSFQIVGSYGEWYNIQLPGGGKAYVASWVVETKVTSRVVSQSSSDSDKQACNGKVYIYHTHNLESWKNVASNTKGTSFDDPKVNISLVGKYLAQQLQEKGMPAIVEEEDFAQNLKDQKLSFGQAYSESRKAVNKAVEANDKLNYFFDIHRDGDVPRVRTTATINDKSYARILFVIGTAHPNYKENKKFADALNERLNKKYPGLSRGILLKSSQDGDGEYNQSVSSGSLLLEIGGVNNTLEESKRTAKALAEVFVEYDSSLK